MFDDKEKEIQTLKKKLKIPATQLTQTEELDDFKKEKETLNAELTDCKSKLLKLEEKERQWGADKSHISIKRKGASRKEC